MAERMKALLCALSVLSLITLTGCGSKSTTDEALEAEKNKGMGPEESLESKPKSGILEGRTSGPMLPVYFDFDASVIKEDQVSRIELNADFIKSKPSLSIRIEGNCDPRGTNEYNMALGERRAISAKKYLVNLGVDEKQLETISYGEERILLHGHDELSWAQNRRDDFVIIE